MYRLSCVGQLNETKPWRAVGMRRSSWFTKGKPVNQGHWLIVFPRNIQVFAGDGANFCHAL
jgi:hypothetical protein